MTIKPIDCSKKNKINKPIINQTKINKVETL